jgi:hypothetical protein
MSLSDVYCRDVYCSELIESTPLKSSAYVGDAGAYIDLVSGSASTGLVALDITRSNPKSFVVGRMSIPYSQLALLRTGSVTFTVHRNGLATPYVQVLRDISSIDISNTMILDFVDPVPFAPGMIIYSLRVDNFSGQSIRLGSTGVIFATAEEKILS